jgi:hypothetical protein
MPWINLRWLALVLGFALMACATEEPAEDEMVEDTTAMAPEPAGPSLADFAGTWTFTGTTSETGETPPPYELTATADESGWTFRFPDFPDRGVIPVRVIEVSGDSVVTDTDRFESALRPGVQVWTHAVYRRQGDGLIGNLVAHYETTGADSVLHIAVEGTRAP